jgi:trans-aconitate methyltransferase
MKAELNFRGVSRAEEEETRAPADLLGRVETRSLRRVADVHAGPWSRGAILAHRFPDAEIVSLDPSDLDDRA